jgi:hypothetical protein
MVDYTTDYWPDSFNKSNGFDLRYNSDFSTRMGATQNGADIKKISGYTVPLLEPEKTKPPLLIDMGNNGLPPGTNNEPGMYDYFIDQQLANAPVPANPIQPSHAQDKFWLEDPGVLFRNGNYYRIIPSKNMTKIQVLNSLTRFFLYLGILYLVFGTNSTYMYIPLIGILVILLLYIIYKHQNQQAEPFTDSVNRSVDEIVEGVPGGVCQAPDKNNPFMNVTMDDLMENRTRPTACPVTNPTIRNQMAQAWNNNLFTDVEDVFDRKHSQRQFYTMPSTTIPNDQTAFAKWLYEAPETCKENQLNCLKYEDIRFSRFNPNIDRMERNEEDLD